ncbi:hypothetical protein COT62_00975 [Candidatus Roizmanbacteria bacterium CG09_land_8_20_14_0_10_41_9]|uniref:SH3b domain-containing protein n=1 Tax=Candidatus Roizmanbacteria bacterium CG09_land_8_20_14_0_10_41_9 TaxID=1974850 RepID=A0A2H0WTE5_9BACT|nr:MAG: hypothetical protein COT62_00975 [Candidatus Roizmanbacteria bacterium CG09_land_8_20_14_0_10_41_9]
MKNKLLLLTVLVAIFAGFIFFRFFFMDQRDASGKLRIASSPEAGVFINNVNAGKTPFENKYKPGEYLLKLIPEGTATDTASWNGKVQIYKNTLTYVNRELGSSDITSAGEIFTTTKMKEAPKNANFGEIYVETDPQGAIISLDNDEKGVAPLILSDVLKGDHELSISMPGFFRRTQKINVDPAYRVNAYFKLAIDQSQKKPEEKKKEATESAKTKKTTITIKDNELGFLRVREEPTVTATEAAQVKPGEKFEVLEEENNWYKINYEEGKMGWVSGEYVTKTEE